MAGRKDDDDELEEMRLDEADNGGDTPGRDAGEDEDSDDEDSDEDDDANVAPSFDLPRIVPEQNYRA